MSENENVVVEPVKDAVAADVENVAVDNAEVTAQEQQAAPPSGKMNAFWAKVKEWFRKQTVKLKKKTHIIPFFFLLVTSIFYLLCLNDFSQSSAVAFRSIEYLGLAVFVNVLFSILVLVLFMNAFPKHPIVNKKTGKRHKVNVVMLVLGFIFIAVMIFLDALYLRQIVKGIPGNESFFFKTMDEANQFKGYWSETFTRNPVLNNERLRPYLLKSYNYAIAHIVLLGVTVLMYALLPLYKMLIMKINTKKVLEENNIKEVIETED